LSEVGIEGASFQKAGDPIMAKRTAKFMAHQNKSININQQNINLNNG
jgi:hypothetical protein